MTDGRRVNDLRRSKFRFSKSRPLTPPYRIAPLQSVACGLAPGSCRLAGRRAELLLPGCEAGWAKRAKCSPAGLKRRDPMIQCKPEPATGNLEKKSKKCAQPLTARDGPALENLELGKRPFVSPERPQSSFQQVTSPLFWSTSTVEGKKRRRFLEM